MFDSIFILLALLFIKHWYVDFVNQSADELAGKGTYGQAHGVMHSIKHGVGTLIIFSLFTWNFSFSVVIAFLDFVLHYHIDWLKTNITQRWNYTMDKPQYWAWLGADQLAHALTYITLAWLAV
jgi:hypothetical protein